MNNRVSGKDMPHSEGECKNWNKLILMKTQHLNNAKIYILPVLQVYLDENYLSSVKHNFRATCLMIIFN